MAKVMVSIPDELLERIDSEAGRRGQTRSALLQGAATRELGHPDPAEMDAAFERARRALATAPGFDAATEVRASRDARTARDRHL